MRRGKILLLCVLFVGWIAMGSSAEEPTQSDIEKRIAAEEKRLADIQRQLEFHKKQVKATASREKDVLGELSRLTQDIGVTEQRLSVLELREQQAKERLANLSVELQETEKRLAKIRELLRRRVVALYKYGGAAQLDMLLSASTTHDALTAAYLLNRMTEEDRRLFEEACERKRMLDQAQAEILRRKAVVVEQQGKVAKERAVLGKSVKARNSFLGDLRAQRGKHEEMAKALARSEAEIERIIRSLVEEKQRIAAAKRQKEAVRTGHSDILLSGPGGPLIWPVRGRVGSPFGVRTHPIFGTKTRHTGIDIEAASGTPALAAANGEVLYSGWLRGYGQIVILDHGRELATAYAHLSRILVDEGQRVKKGQTIGKVGSTGVSTGPHLHFEVRVSGEAKDPMRYLGR